MLLSAVSVLVVAQSSSEIPEGLINNSVYGHEYGTALLYVQAVSRLVFQLLCTCRPCHVSCSSYYVRAGRVTSRVPVIMYVQAVSRLVFQLLCTCRPCHVSCSSYYVHADRVTSRVPVIMYMQAVSRLVFHSSLCSSFHVHCDKFVKSTPRRKLIFVIVKCPISNAPYPTPRAPCPMYVCVCVCVYIYIYIYIYIFPWFISLLCCMCAPMSRFF